ncbi:hypothetical protein SAMN05421813_1291, partial [Daejeonella rubra]
NKYTVYQELKLKTGKKKAKREVLGRS